MEGVLRQGLRQHPAGLFVKLRLKFGKCPAGIRIQKENHRITPERQQISLFIHLFPQIGVRLETAPLGQAPPYIIVKGIDAHSCRSDLQLSFISVLDAVARVS